MIVLRRTWITLPSPERPLQPVEAALEISICKAKSVGGARASNKRGYRGLLSATCTCLPRGAARAPILEAGCDVTYNYYTEAGVGFARHTYETLRPSAPRSTRAPRGPTNPEKVQQFQWSRGRGFALRACACRRLRHQCARRGPVSLYAAVHAALMMAPSLRERPSAATPFDPR